MGTRRSPRVEEPSRDGEADARTSNLPPGEAPPTPVYDFTPACGPLIHAVRCLPLWTPCAPFLALPDTSDFSCSVLTFLTGLTASTAAIGPLYFDQGQCSPGLEAVRRRLQHGAWRASMDFANTPLLCY